MADESSFLTPLLRELTFGVDAWKKPVKVVAASNITLTGLQTVDGVLLGAGDEVVCVAQSSGAQNGIWVAATGAWTRRFDATNSERLFAGVRVPVTHGTHAGEVYRLTTTGKINVGITAQTWEIDSQGDDDEGGSELITETAPSQLPQIGFRANGRPQVFAQAKDGGVQEACDIALSSDVEVRAFVNKAPDEDASSLFWGVICLSVDKELDLQYVTLTPQDTISGHADDYALIRVWSVSGFGATPTLLASRTTQSPIEEISPLSVTLSSTTIAAGRYVYVTINKMGSGVALPAMAIGIRARVKTDYALTEEEE